MKTKEELDIIKSEYEDVKEKLAELTDEELEQVTGGCLDVNNMNPLAEWFNRHPNVDGSMTAREQYYKNTGHKDEYVAKLQQDNVVIMWLKAKYGP